MARVAATFKTMRTFPSRLYRRRSYLRIVVTPSHKLGFTLACIIPLSRHSNKGVQNFLNQTPQGVGGGLCLGTFQKKMKSGVSGAGGMQC